MPAQKNLDFGIETSLRGKISEPATGMPAQKNSDFRKNHEGKSLHTVQNLSVIQYYNELVITDNALYLFSGEYITLKIRPLAWIANSKQHPDSENS